MQALTALLSGYATGWLVAAPIGPVNLEIMRRTVRQGWPNGLALGAGAVVIDVFFFAAFSLGIGRLLEHPSIAVVYGLMSGLLLLWLGRGALLDAWKTYTSRRNPADVGTGGPAGAAVPSPLSSFGTGLLMTGLNPMTIAFWSALSLAFADLDLTARLLSAAGVFAGCTSWVVLIVTLLTLARRRLGPTLFAVMTAAGGAMLIWFAIRAFVGALTN